MISNDKINTDVKEKKRPEKKTKEELKSSRMVFYPRVADHPFPYYISKDAHLYKASEEEAPKHIKLDETVLERFILDTKFAEEFVETNFLKESIDDEIRRVVFTFTKKQGPANKPSDSFINANPVHRKNPNSKKETKDIASEMLSIVETEVIRNLLKKLMWNTVDQTAFNSDTKSLKITKKESELKLKPELIKLLEKHVINVALLLQKKKETSLDHAPFKDLRTFAYIYHFSKYWNELQSEENYATRQLKLRFLNEAIWNFFIPKIIRSVENDITKLDQREVRSRTLRSHSALSNFSVKNASKP